MILLHILFLFTTVASAQEPKQTMLVVKGCEHLTDNLALNNCFNKVISTTLNRKIGESFIKTLNPGESRFMINIEATEDKKIELTQINTTNKKTRKLVENHLNKIKILEPATHEGKPVNTMFSLPLTLRNNIKGPLPVHKIS